MVLGIKMCETWLTERVKAEETCREIIAEVVKKGFQYQISHKDLTKIIMLKRGIDERTVQRWINALVTFDYLTAETTSMYKVYKVNPLRVPELFEILKEKPQTKLS